MACGAGRGAQRGRQAGLLRTRNLQGLVDDSGGHARMQAAASLLLCKQALSAKVLYPPPQLAPSDTPQRGPTVGQEPPDIGVDPHPPTSSGVKPLSASRRRIVAEPRAENAEHQKGVGHAGVA